MGGAVEAPCAAAAILQQLLDHPVFSADDISDLLPNLSDVNIYRALQRLEDDGVIHEVTARKRDRVWAATLVMDELEDLADRIAQRL